MVAALSTFIDRKSRIASDVRKNLHENMLFMNDKDTEKLRTFQMVKNSARLPKSILNRGLSYDVNTHPLMQTAPPACLLSCFCLLASAVCISLSQSSKRLRSLQAAYRTRCIGLLLFCSRSGAGTPLRRAACSPTRLQLLNALFVNLSHFGFNLKEQSWKGGMMSEE